MNALLSTIIIVLGYSTAHAQTPIYHPADYPVYQQGSDQTTSLPLPAQGQTNSGSQSPEQHPIIPAPTQAQHIPPEPLTPPSNTSDTPLFTGPGILFYGNTEFHGSGWPKPSKKSSTPKTSYTSPIQGKPQSSITLVKPNGQMTYWPREGARSAVTFTYGNLDPKQLDFYTFNVYLIQDGVIIGSIPFEGSRTIDPDATVYTTYYPVGVYTDLDGINQSMEPGHNYQFRVALFSSDSLVSFDDSNAPFVITTQPTFLQRLGFKIRSMFTGGDNIQ